MIEFVSGLAVGGMAMSSYCVWVISRKRRNVKENNRLIRHKIAEICERIDVSYPTANPKGDNK